MYHPTTGRVPPYHRACTTLPQGVHHPSTGHAPPYHRACTTLPQGVHHPSTGHVPPFHRLPIMLVFGSPGSVHHHTMPSSAVTVSHIAVTRRLCVCLQCKSRQVADEMEELSAAKSSLPQFASVTTTSVTTTTTMVSNKPVVCTTTTPLASGSHAHVCSSISVSGKVRLLVRQFEANVDRPSLSRSADRPSLSRSVDRSTLRTLQRRLSDSTSYKVHPLDCRKSIFVINLSCCLPLFLICSCTLCCNAALLDRDPVHCTIMPWYYTVILYIVL